MIDFYIIYMRGVTLLMHLQGIIDYLNENMSDLVPRYLLKRK